MLSALYRGAQPLCRENSSATIGWKSKKIVLCDFKTFLYKTRQSDGLQTAIEYSQFRPIRFSRTLIETVSFALKRFQLVYVHKTILVNTLKAVNTFMQTCSWNAFIKQNHVNHAINQGTNYTPNIVNRQMDQCKYESIIKSFNLTCEWINPSANQRKISRFINLSIVSWLIHYIFDSSTRKLQDQSINHSRGY